MEPFNKKKKQIPLTQNENKKERDRDLNTLVKIYDEINNKQINNRT